MRSREEDELRQRILGQSDGQLRRMVTMDIKDYRPEAIAIANEELVRRGLEPGQAGEMKEPDIECLRCKSKMAFAGKKRFYQLRRRFSATDSADFADWESGLQFISQPNKIRALREIRS